MYHASAFLGLGEMQIDGKIAPKKLFNINMQ
jgi:tRNA pseudouridine55 synthase